MKTRIIVAAVGIPVILLIIFLAPVWVLGIAVGLIAACCAWELIRCTNPDEKPRLHVYAAIAGFALPFLTGLTGGTAFNTVVVFLLFAALFCELMLSFRTGEPMDFSVPLTGLLAGGIMPLLIAAIVRLGLREHGSVYVLLPFVAAFSSDSGAYFAGTFLGKHKMTPHLSPHKTIEGSIGGFLAAVIMMLIYGFVLKALHFTVNIPVMCVYGFLGSLACQLGDLCFSAIKRLHGIKDYGNLIPGHGGMLDRFDSMFWTAAMIEILVNWAPAIF